MLVKLTLTDKDIIISALTAEIDRLDVAIAKTNGGAKSHHIVERAYIIKLRQHILDASDAHVAV